MAVIAISRELGSGGHEIGERVAARLGYAFVDKQTADAIFRQYGLTKFDEVYDTAPSWLDLINSNNLLIISMLNEILEAVAKRGNAVILGRGGFAVLGDYADVLTVRVSAPLAQRVERMIVREALPDRTAAEQRVADDDNLHSKFVQRFYNKRWDDPANFALMIDTSKVSMDAAVEQIVAAARELEQRVPEAGVTTTASIQVDLVLADAVAKAIKYPLATRIDR
jgi:cytidylate kinase